jgi:hypothetical protein
VGADPDATWAELLALEQAGVIEDLDYDYCREFFPEGAGQGDPTLAGWGDLGWVPRASFTPELGWSGTLRDLGTGAALADGAVLLSPLPGSPFRDPGWTPDDGDLPLLQRTGPDGSFGVQLDGLRGPLLTSVGYGWNSSSKLVLVAEPPSEPAPPPSPPPGTKTATPGGGTPASRPPPTKPEGDICGPDVTDYVLGSLEHMLATWDGWTPEQRKANCSVLFNWKRFQAAWDMKPFAPSEGEDYMTHKFFQRAAPDVCAEPDWPCGNTVEFMGFCVSGQVVNYVQWGAMNEVCDDEVLGFVALHARSFFSPDSTGQEAMRHLGAYFARYRGDSLEFRRQVMTKILQGEIAADNDEWYEMAGTNCQLVCEEIADPKPWLDTIDWGFQWGDEFVSVTGRNLPRP